MDSHRAVAWWSRVIDFSLSDEQREPRALARAFAGRELRPLAAACDEADEFPRDLVARAAAVGLTGYTLPAEHGGGGCDAVTSAIVAEELAVGDVSLAASLGGAGLCGGPIALA